MIEIIKEKLGAEKFNEIFPTIVDVQTTFNDMQSERATKVFEMHEYDHTKVTDRQKIIKWQKERSDLMAEIPGLSKAAEVITDARIRSEYVKKLHSKTDKVETLNQRLANKDSKSMVRDALKYASDKRNVEAMDAWAEEVGKWFETGALGEGSVTYNKKTYTYKK